MNIYIYGNQNFKKEIHETLDHSNIKFKLDDETLIKEINTASELMEIIKNNPKDIYLIDDEKIIKKNSLNQKIKFLKPKDGIEEDFLLDSGIADLSIDSLKEIPKYILKKYDEEKLSKKTEIYVSNDNSNVEKIELDEELASLLSKEEITEKITNSEEDSLDDIFDIETNINLDEIDDIIGKVEDKSDKKISKEEFNDIMDFNNSFGLNNISFDYDDNEIVNDKLEEIDFLQDFNKDEDSVEEIFDEIDFLDEILGKKVEEKVELTQKETVESTKEENRPFKGDVMSQDEFSELDSLNEKDLLEALNYSNKDLGEIFKEESSMIQKNINNNSTSINLVESANVNELASLLSKLLNNKTLEITIKIKD